MPGPAVTDITSSHLIHSQLISPVLSETSETLSSLQPSARLTELFISKQLVTVPANANVSTLFSCLSSQATSALLQSVNQPKREKENETTDNFVTTSALLFDMASTTSSFTSGMRLCSIFAAVVYCVFTCLSSPATALPMKTVIGEALMQARLEQQGQHHRQRRAVTKTECVRPQDTDLDTWFTQMNAELGDAHFLQKLKGNQSITIPAGEYPTWHSPDNEDKECPATVNRDMTAPLRERSLCPYYFDVIQFPEGYYPQTLLAAKCKCQVCLEQTAFGCETVFTSVSVLKPDGCHQGLQKYREEIKEIPTSCTCAYKGGAAAATTTTTTPAPVDPPSFGVN